MTQQFLMFLCTLNNPQEHGYPDDEGAERYLKEWKQHPGVCYVIGQLERGKDNTLHLQYFVQFEKTAKKTVTGMKKYCKFSHFEPVRQNNGADDYCMKEDTKVSGPWEYGIRPARKNQKGDTKRFNQQIEAMGSLAANDAGLIKIVDVPKYERAIQLVKLLRRVATTTDDVRGEWHYGVSGSGKSHAVREKYPDFFDKGQNKWFDGYQGEKMILIDDLDCTKLAHFLKRWADKYACKGEAKGYTVPLQHESICITSNFSIEELFKEYPQVTVTAIKRRFKAFHYPFEWGHPEWRVDIES